MPPPNDPNLGIAVETLIEVFGTQSWIVRSFIETWQERSEQYGLEYVLNTAAASVRPIDADTMEIKDQYHQFESTRISASSLMDALHALIEAMDDLNSSPSE
jgi:hypothetical protein